MEASKAFDPSAEVEIFDDALSDVYIASNAILNELLANPEISSYADAVLGDAQVDNEKHFQVCDALGLEPDEAALLLDYFEALGVKVITPENEMDKPKILKVSADTDSPEYTTDPLQLYLNEAGRHKILTREEEVALAKKRDVYLPYRITSTDIKDLPPGETEDTLFEKRMAALPSDKQELKARIIEGKAAFKKLVECNLKLVVSIAKNYSYTGITALDLIQEGNLGLIRAAEKFDWRQGYKFSTYATWWIRQGVTRGAADKSRVIRLPVHMVERVNKVKQAEVRLSKELRRKVHPIDLANDLGMSVDEVEELLRIEPRATSLNMPVGEKEDAELGDFVADETAPAPDEAVAETLRTSYIQEALNQLPERLREVLELRFGLDGGNGMTLEEIGKRLGVTRERIRQLETEGKKRLEDSETFKKAIVDQ
jgi:RNA polymerase sigma factor (sigma-70 family)